jgi:hypothetical protein
MSDDYEKGKEKDLRRRRRIEKDRKREKARGVWRDVWGRKGEQADEYEEEFVCTHADNLKACSCEMCKTPRKSGYVKGDDKLTMQERRFTNGEEEVV